MNDALDSATKARARLPNLPRNGHCLSNRDQLSRFNFRQPQARLLAMMFFNMTVRARAVMLSPWRTATVRAEALSGPAVMIP